LFTLKTNPEAKTEEAINLFHCDRTEGVEVKYLYELMAAAAAKPVA